MSFEFIEKLLNGNIVCGNEKNLFHGKFKLDSRKIETGDCFIVINSGFNYIDDAIKNGAVLIISEQEYHNNITTIKVDDIHHSLIVLAHYIRNKYKNIPLIAVTGSVGKTTTKELISSILESKYKVLKSSGNNNNNIGVPLTMFDLDDNHEICVLELGMNHLGEIDELSRCVEPTDAVITNVGTSHIGYLGSQKKIYKAKKEIINGMKEGYLFINGDDKYLNKIRYNSILRVGLNKYNDLVAYNIITTKEKMYFTVNIDNKRYNVVFNISNKLLIYNILLAIEVGLKYGIPITTILKNVRAYKPLNHRNNIIKLNNGIIIIDDCYNSCYESLIGSLEMIHHYNQEKILIIGDILELGKYSKKIHKKIGSILESENSLIVLVGNDIKYAKKKNFLYFKNNCDVINLLKNYNLENKLIYLKGSRGMRLEEIKEYIEKKY